MGTSPMFARVVDGPAPDANSSEPAANGSEGEPKSSGSVVDDIVAQYGPDLVKRAVVNPEVAAVISVVLLAHKYHPGFRSLLHRIIGGK